ncbi:glycosyltransferase family 2 protein [Pseudonocardia pini]|uniref:glycosyltransferase family 2 protein n=1 Tax=Pseudonocardia pini TaxID=2758030 RepID=UPI0015F0B65E|nr:glycosyltransferase family 2 protein [Pseudonocardia pini]
MADSDTALDIDTGTRPRFTVVTIAYNNLAGLRRTVESVDAQDHPSYEHLVIDGASTDGTVDWLRELPENPARTVVSEPDKGIYDAMNKGLRAARGEILIVMNSGDTFTGPDTLSLIAADHAEHGWDWAYGAIRMTDPTGRPIGAYSFDPFKHHLFTLGLAWIPHASVAVTRELADKLGPYREDLGSVADQEYLMRAAAVVAPRVITWFLADYEMGGVSQQSSARARELAWHRMRAETGQLWRNSRLADRAVAETLAFGQVLRAAAKRVHGQVSA